MSDVLYHGTRFRTFNVPDDFNPGTLTIEIDASLSSQCLMCIFEQLKATRGLPDVLRPDNDPEFLEVCFTTWCKDKLQAADFGYPDKNYGQEVIYSLCYT